MSKWEYGGAYLRHDMSGPIDLPNRSMVQVQDITEGMPQFMKSADVVFVDPPCNTGNLKTFHTKAGQGLLYSFSDFEASLFSRLDGIAPRQLFVEVFKSNRDAFTEQIKARYANVRTYESHYYDKPQNKCWIIHASNDDLQPLPIDGIDESRVIAWICKNLSFSCIGDLCMGRGTVGWHAYKNGRRFVGTELNPKRLAVLVEKISKEESKLRVCT